MANPLLDDPALDAAIAKVKGGSAAASSANPLLSDTSLDQAIAAVKAKNKPTPESTLAREAGLTTRNAIEGLAGAAGMITDPFVMAIGGAVRAATGSDYDPVTLSKIGQSVANALGLPQPETGTERVSSALQKGLVSGGGSAALASQVAQRSTGIPQFLATQLAAQPGLQAISGASAGASGQLAAEAGAGPGGQLAAALAGGIAAPVAASGIARAIKAPASTISPAQQAILDAGKAADVPVLTSDILPPESFVTKSMQSIGERIPVLGTGGTRQAQQAAREASVAETAAQYGKPDYEAIVESVKGRVGGIKKAAGRVINQTGAQLDAAGPVAPVKSVQAIDDAIANLSRPQVYKPGYQGYIDDLQAVKDSFAANPTYTNLRESRTALREVMDSVDPMGRSQLPSQTKALFAKTYSALKNDMDDFAAANLPQNQIDKLNRANIVYGETAGLLKNTRLKNVLDKGDVKPEVVKGIIFSGQPSEMKTLYNALGPVGRQNVKSALIDDAASKSVLANGEINPNRFGAELAKRDKNIDVFFKGQERDAVKGLTRLMQVTRRGQDAALAPTNGSAAIPYAMGAGAIADLGATLAAAATGGGIARIYESAPVRNLLLKLANTPANTRQEGEIIRKIYASIQAAKLQQSEQEKERQRQEQLQAQQAQ